MKKASILLLSALILGMELFGQTPYDPEKNIRTAFEKSRFIFEGKIIERKVIYDTIPGKNGGTKYASLIIQVDKIFKGKEKLKIGTIEIIQDAGDFTIHAPDEVIITTESQSHPASPKPQITQSGVYFCNEITHPRLPNAKTVNSIILEESYDNIVYGIHSITNEKYYTGFGKKFNSADDVYEFIKEYLTPPKEEK